MKTIQKVVCLSLIVAGASVNAAQQAPVTDISAQSTSDGSDRIATIVRMIEASNQRQLIVQQQLDALLEEVNQLRGETEVHSHKLEQLVERQRELYQELEDRFTRLQSTQQQQAKTVLLDTTTAQSTSPSPANQTTKPEVVYSDDIKENEAYDHAMNLVLKARKYEQAIPEFQAFIQRFPDSEYAPNAHYWLGQLLFNKGNYAEAKGPFERVVNFYPDSNKRSDAIYKLGSIALKTNNKLDAKVLFERVISEYPGSTAAKLATSRLKNLK
jgi:tol-pal system protein YbgF